MSPQRVSESRKSKSSRFAPKVEVAEEEVDEEALAQRTKDLGLSQIDSSFAINQCGGVVVVMQELHNESAQDTGDFVAVQSKFDKRKQAQVDREEFERKRKADEKKAAIALKKAEEVRLAEEAKAAADAIAAEIKREADLKKEEARKAKKEAERKEAERKEAERKEAERKEAERKETERKETVKRELAKKELAKEKSRIAPPPPSIMRDSAVVGIGNVIVPKKVTKLGTIRRDAEAQTDPVRILPIEQQPSLQSMVYAPSSVVGPTVTSSAARPGAAAAAWWLQQVTPPSQNQNNEFLMYPPQQAPPQASNYYYQNNDQMYWQNAYQTAPGGRFPPRRQ